jgi:hypothetical protein
MLLQTQPKRQTAPSCHQSHNSAALIDMHDSKMETATVIAEFNTPPTPMKDYKIKMVCPKNKDSQDMMSDFICNMFKQDKVTIYAYDPTNSDNYPNLCISKDIPNALVEFSKYFAKMWDSWNKSGTTIAFQISSTHHHVKWKQILHDEICKTKVKIRLLNLDSIDIKMIGFLMCKLPSETHLHCYGDYLKEINPETMPKIKLACTYPKTQAGFDKVVKTKLVVVKTSKEHADATDLILTQLLPASPMGEMYVSFQQGMDETMLKCLYK